jgi:hypothetical protein
MTVSFNELPLAVLTWDLGTGVLGDIGCHNPSAAFKALKLRWPESVAACSTHWNAPPEVKNETAPLASIVTYRFAAEGNHPEILLRWYDGGMMAPLPKEVGTRNIFVDDGTLIVGDEGMLLGAQLLPEAKAKLIGKPPQVLARSPGHYQEWIDACKGGKPAGSNFVDHAGLLAAVVLMGNIAIRTQQKLLWDAENLRFTNSEAANQLLDPPYREGWTLQPQALRVHRTWCSTTSSTGRSSLSANECLGQRQHSVERMGRLPQPDRLVEFSPPEMRLFIGESKSTFQRFR